MNQRLARPSAMLFPALCLIAALLRGAETVFLLLVFYFSFQLLTLCAPDAFRNAAAREPGVRRVDKRFGGAIAQILIGAAVLAAGLYFMPKPGETDTFTMTSIILPAAAALLIIIEQTFEERMFALGRPIDGSLLALIANLLLAVGLAFPGENCEILAASAAAGTLIALIASPMVAPMKSFSLLPRNYGYSPKAAAQTLLYPAAAAALMNFIEIDLPHALAGWILWRLARTTCRRAADESRPMNLTLITVCACAVGASVFLPWMAPYALACLLALICACVVFLAPSARLYIGVGLLLIADARHYFINFTIYAQVAACVLAAAAIILNLKNALLRKVSA